MLTLVRDCDFNWSLSFLWGSEFEINSVTNRSVCENAVMVAGSQLLLEMYGVKFYVHATDFPPHDFRSRCVLYVCFIYV